MPGLSKLIKNIGWQFGFHISRLTPFGNDVHRDINAIAGPANHEVLFDVGANTGQTALAFSAEYPHAAIYSFEPFPEAFRQLQKAVASLPRVTPINCALGEKPGTQTLYLTKYTCTNSLLPTSSSAANYLGDLVQKNGEITVPMQTLDNFCEQNAIAKVDLLKLDTQGYELKVLAGASNLLKSGRIKLILTEVNFVSLYEKQAYFHEVYQFLRENGFGLVSLYHLNYRLGASLSWCDALFVKLTPDQAR